MNATESALRSIKDRVAAVVGELDESAPHYNRKEEHRRLVRAAADLHRCADEMQDIMMRVRPK